MHGAQLPTKFSSHSFRNSEQNRQTIAIQTQNYMTMESRIAQNTLSTTLLLLLMLLAVPELVIAEEECDFEVSFSKELRSQLSIKGDHHSTEVYANGILLTHAPMGFGVNSSGLAVTRFLLDELPCDDLLEPLDIVAYFGQNNDCIIERTIGPLFDEIPVGFSEECPRIYELCPGQNVSYSLYAEGAVSTLLSDYEPFVVQTTWTPEADWNCFGLLCMDVSLDPVTPGQYKLNWRQPGAYIGGVVYFDVRVIDCGLSSDAAVELSLGEEFLYPGNKSLEPRIFNAGEGTLSSFDLRWSVNGIEQQPSFVTQETIPKSYFLDAELAPYNFEVETDYEIRVWTANPNGSVDTNNSNDTIIVNAFIPDYNVNLDLINEADEIVLAACGEELSLKYVGPIGCSYHNVELPSSDFIVDAEWVNQFGEVLEVEVDPNNVSGIDLVPMHNDLYTVTVYYDCWQSFQQSYYVIAVGCTEEIEEEDDSMFTEFDWLSEHIDSTDCLLGSQILRYQQGTATYIQIVTEAETQLYGADGSLYCTDNSSLNCAEFYGLAEPTSSWTCNTLACDCAPAPGGSLPYCGLDGEIYNSACEAHCAGTVIASNIPCDQPQDPNGSFTLDYEWLAEIVDPSFCNHTIVREYQSGDATYIYINNVDAHALYDEDGNQLCNYNCLDEYGLGLLQQTGFWTCTSTADCACENIYAPVCATDGTTYDNACEAACVGAVLLSNGACDLLNPAPPMFSDFPWLNNEILWADCALGESVEVYDLGSYSFVYVVSDDLAQLFYEDGTLYCTSGPQYDCRGFYGLYSPTSIWECNGLPTADVVLEICPGEVAIGSVNLIEEIDCASGTDGGPFGSITYEPEEGLAYLNYLHVEFSPTETTLYTLSHDGYQCGEPYSEQTTYLIIVDEDCDSSEEANWVEFGPYNWINALDLELDCSSDDMVEIVAYDMGAYSFVLIDDGSGLSLLYFEDGSIYCSDSQSFSCADFYGLGSGTAELLWSCAGKTKEPLMEEVAEQSLEMTLYPNPGQGQFSLDCGGLNETQYLLSIYDLQGRHVYAQSYSVEREHMQLDLDLSMLETGMYLVQLASPENSVTKRLQIVR